MKIKAIIFGASGMVGNGVLIKTLQDPDVESVLVVGRRPCGIKDVKMKEIIHNDFYDYKSIEHDLKGFNACFFCLGVSSVGMNEADYTGITYDLTMETAKTLSKLSPEMTFCYVSGEGTDSTEKGRLMWARVKGRTENHLMNLPFKAAYMFRPGFMKPVEGQLNLKPVFKAFGYLYPVVKFIFPSHGCKLEDVGKAMIRIVKAGYSKRILENIDIEKVAGSFL
jgi:uncharacterized protein YbjT (DUF2867 family)